MVGLDQSDRQPLENPKSSSISMCFIALLCPALAGRWQSLWSQPKFGFPKGRNASAVVGCWLSRCPTASGYVSGSGVWVGARKLEGELDVGQSRLDETGESLVVTAEPAWFWTDTESELPIVGREETTQHRGRMVSLLFDIVPETG